MTDGLPGLLQPWGIVLLASIALAAFAITPFWILDFGFWNRSQSESKIQNPKSKIHLDVAAITLLAFLTGGFFWRPLTESATKMPAGGGDLASFYFPTYAYVAQQIKGGSIPLWNPHLFAGMPLAADVQTAMFYPVNWILFLFVNIDLDNYGALEWLLITHYWLAATFTYLFLRDIGLKRLGALGGGIAFAFCGFMVAHFGHLPMVPVATWIPLVLLALRRSYLSAGRAGWAWAIAAGLFMAMSLLAGHVQIFAYGLMAAGLLWVVLGGVGGGGWGVRRDEASGNKDSPLTPHPPPLLWLTKGTLALALALAIGAIQLLPSLELSTQSVRSSVSYEEASEFPAQPLSLLNLILPTVYGSNPTNYAFGQWQTTENWGYCGVVTLALAALGLALKRTRMVAFFALLVALALIIMMGDLTIVGGWIYKFVPGFNKLRDSGRALVLLGFGLAGLAGYGLDGLVAALGQRRRTKDEGRIHPLSTIMWWLVGVTGVVAIFAFGIMPALYKEILANKGAEYGRLPIAINNLGVAILWLGLLAGIGWAAYRGRLQPAWAGALVFGLLVLDIFSPNSRFNPTTSDILAGFKRFDGYAVVKHNMDDPQTGIPLRLNSDTDVQGVWQPSSAVLHDFYDTGGAWNPLKLQRYDYLWHIANTNPETGLYDLTGAALQVISPTVDARAGQTKWDRIHYETNFEVYNNKNVLPRAFLVHDAVVENNYEKAIEALRDFTLEPRHTVILESGTPVRSAQLGTAEQGADAGESVHATRYTPNDVDITVRATSPGWLVLTDAWYPGWQATVDGLSVPIEPANYAYRAIRVEAGEHQVAMHFRPASWVWGRLTTLVATAASAVALASILAWPRIKKTRKNAKNLLTE